MARRELLYRLSPARPSPRLEGEGLPVVQNVVLVAGSYEPVIHAGAPPIFQDSPPPFLGPASAGPGAVEKRHLRSRVFASYASMKPRIPYSPPLTPTMTR